LSEANKNIVANLEIGQQIAVTKTFPAGVVPQSVTEYLFVEGISHKVTPETHVVTIYTGPATTYLQWTLSNFLVTTTRLNRVTNPSVEASIGGWVTSNGTLSRSSTFAYAGTFSARTETTVAGFVTTNQPTANSVTAGQAYTYSAYVRSSVARQCRIYISWYNGGTSVGTSLGSYITSSISDWTRCSLTATAPATATIAYLVTQTASSQIGDLVYWDAFLLENGSTLLPYFDGTYVDPYTGYTLLSQQWNGTANASTSTATWGLDSSNTGSPLNDSTYGLA
jgi:hypothetical protein